MNAGGQRDAARGFALIEVLVALTLLAVGIVAVLGASVASVALQKDALLRHRAGLVLQDKLAEAAWSSGLGTSASGVAADDRIRWMRFTEPWEVAATKGLDTNSRLERVVVEVEWSTPRGIRRIRAAQIVCIEAMGGAAR